MWVDPMGQRRLPVQDGEAGLLEPPVRVAREVHGDHRVLGAVADRDRQARAVAQIDVEALDVGMKPPSARIAAGDGADGPPRTSTPADLATDRAT